MEPGEIQEAYSERENQIRDRLEKFRELRDADDTRLFKELVFVILTSQSNAKNCWEATEKLDELSLLEKGSRAEIAEVLKRYDIQYEENKAEYIVRNRENLSQPTLKDTSGELKLRDRIDSEALEKTREQLVEQLQGIGWKGASHFLRNIGYGDDFAILSGYIMKKLHKLDLVESPEPPQGKEEYLEVEKKLQELADKLEIDIQELDLLLWSMETGEIFK